MNDERRRLLKNSKSKTLAWVAIGGDIYYDNGIVRKWRIPYNTKIYEILITSTGTSYYKYSIYHSGIYFSNVSIDNPTLDYYGTVTSYNQNSFTTYIDPYNNSIKLYNGTNFTVTSTYAITNLTQKTITSIDNEEVTGYWLDISDSNSYLSKPDSHFRARKIYVLVEEDSIVDFVSSCILQDYNYSPGVNRVGVSYKILTYPTQTTFNNCVLYKNGTTEQLSINQNNTEIFYSVNCPFTISRSIISNTVMSITFGEYTGSTQSQYYSIGIEYNGVEYSDYMFIARYPATNISISPSSVSVSNGGSTSIQVKNNGQNIEVGWVSLTNNKMGCTISSTNSSNSSITIQTPTLSRIPVIYNTGQDRYFSTTITGNCITIAPTTYYARSDGYKLFRFYVDGYTNLTVSLKSYSYGNQAVIGMLDDQNLNLASDWAYSLSGSNKTGSYTFTSIPRGWHQFVVINKTYGYGSDGYKLDISLSSLPLITSSVSGTVDIYYNENNTSDSETLTITESAPSFLEDTSIGQGGYYYITGYNNHTFSNGGYPIIFKSDNGLSGTYTIRRLSAESSSSSGSGESIYLFNPSSQTVYISNVVNDRYIYDDMISGQVGYYGMTSSGSPIRVINNTTTVLNNLIGYQIYQKTT